MGMYSFFEDENISVKDWEGLKRFLKDWKESYPDSWINSKEYPMIDDEANLFTTEEAYFTFMNWTNIKLISYWYDNTVKFLRLVAPYIEGEVYWEFETRDEAGWIQFSDGNCIINWGVMEWGNTPAEEMIRERETLENDEKYKELVNKHVLPNKI